MLFYAREGQTKWQLTKLLYENWIDGYKYYGRYVNEKTINYVSKYMTKKAEDNPDYISIVLCSKGLGANYAKENQLKHRWNKEKTIVTYKAHNGQDYHYQDTTKQPYTQMIRDNYCGYMPKIKG